MKGVEFCKEGSKFLFCICPDHKDVVYVERSFVLSVEEFADDCGHEDVGDGGGESCSHGCPFYLLEDVSSEREVVVVNVSV